LQGLAGALYEEFLYDERGEPLSVTLGNYLMPTLRETPLVDLLITEDAPSALNPLGIKGVGEGGITGVGAAIDGAIGVSPVVTQLPATSRS
jgi:aerobic carbon-monoxide dehydrogenase large subunit